MLLLRGFPTDGTPSLSYLGKPTGSLVGAIPGPQGKKGDKGDKGDQGLTGPANELSIGTVTKGDEPAATITGEAPSQELNLVLPKGDKGDKGDQGDRGDPGSGASTWDEVSDKPTEFPPAPHTHVIADVDGLQDALDDKLDQTQVDARVAAGTAALVDSAPETLDTLNELSTALGDDPNFATTVANQIGTKADQARKVSAGTGLTGGGDLTADRTLAVDFGTGAGKVTQGNDPRLSDTRTPTDDSVTTAKIVDGNVTMAKLGTGKVTGSVNGVLTSLTVWTGTQAQYDAIGTKDLDSTIYVVSE